MSNASILVVDDTLNNLRVLSNILRDEGYEIRVAKDGPTALSSVQAAHPDLILLDIMMPGMDGYEVCENLKADSDTQEIPIIFISALDRVLDKVKAFSAGAVDYIEKPFQEGEVIARVKTQISLREMQIDLENKVKQLEIQNAKLETEIKKRIAAEEELHRLAITDPLTGVFNRRHFFQLAEAEFERAVRTQQPVSVVLMDIDHFKNVNDTHGHQNGDLVLRNIAEACRGNLRQMDVLARYGGEEFIILLPNMDEEHALKAAEKVRKIVENMNIEITESEISITASFGVASLIQQDKGIDELIDRADKNLYLAKESGRNRVVAS